jgi:hypothetical protein
MAVLTLVATQLTLTDETMARIATLERSSDHGAYGQVVCVGTAHATYLDASCITSAQAGARESEQSRLVDERTIPREKTTTLRNAEPRTC